MKELPGFIEIDRLIRSFLREDLGRGDITTQLIFSSDPEARARIIAREEFIFSGGPFAERVFRVLDPGVEVQRTVDEGENVQAGQEIMVLRGKVSVLFAGERVALNLLQRLSGISTLTRRYVNRLAGHKACLLDTRKTTPGIRYLEKYAVRIGGGGNHRFRLDDGILIKTNHIRVAGSVSEAFRRVRERAPHHLSIEIEVCNFSELEEAVKAGATLVLLDNMSTEEIRHAVNDFGGRIRLEVSGGVKEENICEFAETGVDFISAGAVIHSARWVNIAMEVEPVEHAKEPS